MQEARFGVLDQLRVQTVGHRLGIARVGGGHVGIEPLGLGLGHAPVVVARRGQQQVVARFLVQARGIELRIEDGGAHLVAHLGQFAEALRGNRGDGRTQVLLAELGHELVVRIVVVDSVGEPHLLEVLFECEPLRVGAVAAVVLIHGFERAPNGQVEAEVLVEEDVATALGRLGQIVYQLLFAQRERIEARHFIADDLHVVEAIDDPRSLRLLSPVASDERRSCQCHSCKSYQFFHEIRVLGPKDNENVPNRRTHGRRIAPRAGRTPANPLPERRPRLYYTRCGVTVSVRCGVTVSVRRGVGAASRGRSACSATCRCPFLMLRIGPEGRSASEVSCRRSFRAVPASVPLPPRPAGGLSASGRRAVPHPGGPFRRPFPAPRARRNALRTTFSARRRTCDDFFYQKIFRFVYTNF